jgi:pilus assembly protein CpaB
VFRRTRVLFVLALLCAAVAVYAGVAYVHGYLRLEPVVVTVRNVLPGEVLTSKDVKTKDVPASIVPPGVVTSIQDAAGKAVMSFLAAGSPVSRSVLQPPQASGLAGRLNAYPGRQAVAIQADAYTTVGYNLKDGDWVDVILTPKQGEVAPVVVQNIPVLAAPAQGQQGTALVLGVDDDQRALLITALVSGQDVRITLRPTAIE